MIKVISTLLLCLQITIADLYERQLYKDLLENYNTLERPVVNNSETVQVNMEMTLFQIVNLEEKMQIIRTNLWLKFTWTDYNLKWSPEEYGGIKEVRVPPEKLWKPDVLLYNNVDANFQSYFPSNMIVQNDGSISWIPPAIMQSSCKMDITWFPFDDQLCCLKFGSWTYNAMKVNLSHTTNGWDLSEYLENGEWLLIDTPVIRTERLYACCPNEPYPDVRYCLHLRRRTLYYGVNMILPSVLISLMTLLGFLLPVESGEKLTLEITVLLSVCVFLTMVGQMTPSTSEAVPLIGIFFSVHMVIVSASVFFNVVVLNLHYRSPDMHKMSNTTRKVLLHWLPRLLLITPVSSERNLFYAEGKTLLNNHAKLGQATVVTPEERVICQELKDLKRCVQGVLKNSRDIRELLRKGSLDEEARSEWRFAAMVVDRVCLIIFSFAIVISICGIFAMLPRN